MLSPDTHIEAERIRLRPISRLDIPFVFDASRHEGFCDGMSWEPPVKEEELLIPYQSNIESWSNGTAYVFTIEHLTEGYPIGRVCIRQLEGTIWDFGYWTHPKFYGQGYMTEAVKTLMKFAFSELVITEFQAAYDTWNTASKRVLEKAGFTFLRHEPTAHMKYGKPVDQDIMHITRDSKTTSV